MKRHNSLLTRHPRIRWSACCLPLACALLLLCGAPVRQYYTDVYFPEDNIYENKSLGFCLTFRGRWNIITDPEKMNRHYRLFARTLQQAGGELLFMGSSVEGLYGTKAVTINLNEPPEEYAGYIRSINKEEIDRDSTFIPFFTEHFHAVKWIYDKAGYRFVEFFFTVDTYNVRLSFWTRPELFDNFLPVFEEIMSSTTVTAGF